MYPEHENLLPAYFDDPSKSVDRSSNSASKDKWVSKPLFGREGYGVFISQNFSNFNEFVKKSEENLKDEGKSIYQQFHKLPEV